MSINSNTCSTLYANAFNAPIARIWLLMSSPFVVELFICDSSSQYNLKYKKSVYTKRGNGIHFVICQWLQFLCWCVFFMSLTQTLVIKWKKNDLNNINSNYYAFGVSNLLVSIIVSHITGYLIKIRDMEQVRYASCRSKINSNFHA